MRATRKKFIDTFLCCAVVGSFVIFITSKLLATNDGSLKTTAAALTKKLCSVRERWRKFP